MPSTATVTAYYTFVANTRAKAAEVNNNFSLYRGHMIPIEPLTATSSHLQHDLGSTDHSWRVGYMQSLSLRTATTTARFIIQGNAAVTAGAADFLFDSTTICSFDLEGMKRHSLENANNRMTTTALGTKGYVINPTTSTAFVNVTNMSVSITPRKGPIEITLCADPTTAGSAIYVAQLGATTGVTTLQVRVYRDTTTSLVEGMMSLSTGITSTSAYLSALPSAFRWYDESPTANTLATYVLQVSNGGELGTIHFTNVKMRLREL